MSFIPGSPYRSQYPYSNNTIPSSSKGTSASSAYVPAQIVPTNSFDFSNTGTVNGNPDVIAVLSQIISIIISLVGQPSNSSVSSANDLDTGNTSGSGKGQCGSTSGSEDDDASVFDKSGAKTGKTGKSGHSGKSHHGGKTRGQGEDSTESSDDSSTEGNPPVVTGAGDTQGKTTGSTPSKTGNNDMDRWDAQIEAASKSTGLPANYIKATIWAESRGNPNDPSKNPEMDAIDEGVMQISDETYGDVSSNQPNAPKGLKAGNPDDNIMMGAWELKDKLDSHGGDFKATSNAYVGEGINPEYADNVMLYWKELDNGEALTDN